MVSYYNPSTVAMFTGSGRYTHHHPHHHSPPAQNPYFTPAAYGAYPHQQSTAGGSPLGAMGVGVGVPPGIHGTQFSPNMASDINCNQYHPATHPQHFNPVNVMASADSWHHHQTSFTQYSSACQAARNAAAATLGYDEWTNPHGHMHPGTHPPHPSFYHAPSPPSSTPSPNSNAINANSPINSGYSNNSNNNSASTPNNNSNNNPSGTPTFKPESSFKTEFGPCSNGNPSQESELGGGGQPLVTSAAPHSPDSGMAISDGVSSSGSPQLQYPNNNNNNNNGVANGNHPQAQQCLGGPASSGAGSSAGSMSSSSSSENPLHLHHNNHHHHLIHQGSQSHLQYNNLMSTTNANSSGSHSPLINVSNGRPTQARSPYEWMKKPAYPSAVATSSSNNAKTRTKDKYRVVYSDTQRLELEKEFHYSRYITIRRKSELAVTLGLSERQVKIWFQNRRAKERKIHRKRDEMMSRDKMASMVHMQNVGGMGMGNPMCSQSIPLM